MENFDMLSRLGRNRLPVVLPAVLVLAVLTAGVAVAQPRPTSDLLLPYFEVDLTGFERTTLFNLTSSGEEPVQVRMVVHSNWGIPLEEVQVTLGPQETRAFNLRDWLLLGELPRNDGLLAALAPQRLAHVQSALSGVRSPESGMYYGTRVLPDLAVGYVTIRAQGAGRGDVLWGNYYIIDPQDDAAQGDILVDIDPAHDGHGLCSLHRLFFAAGGAFDGGTEVIVWNPGQSAPSATPEPAAPLAGLQTLARDVKGEVVHEGTEGLLATQTMKVKDVTLASLAGSLELHTVHEADDRPVDSFIAVRYSAENRYSVALRSWCQPRHFDGSSQDRPAHIDLETLTNGLNADHPTGPRIQAGDAVAWEYIVRNTGGVTLTDLAVTDDRGADVGCPETDLAAGRSMTCTARGVAVAGQYSNLGTVVGMDPDGATVSDSDPSHYLGVEPEPLVEVDLETATDGHDADVGPGPELEVGRPVTWTFRVTNKGEVELLDLAVTDDVEGAVACPRDRLAPGESMTCTARGVARPGPYRNLGTVTGRTEDGLWVTDRDPSHYFGIERNARLDARLTIYPALHGSDRDNDSGCSLG